MIKTTIFFVISVILISACAPGQPSAEVSTPAAQQATAMPSPTSTPTFVERSASTVEPQPATPITQPAEKSDLPTPVSLADVGHQPETFLGYTYQRADGNRWVAGQGALPGSQPLDVPLTGEPAWIVAAPFADGSLWAVILADSRLQTFRVIGDEVEEVSIRPEQLLPGMPPLLKTQGETATLLNAPIDAPSPLTHPVLLEPSDRLAFVHAGGDVILWDGAKVARLEVKALPDARLLVDEAERMLLLTEPTTRYAHGVLGDPMEAASITLIETQPTPRVALKIPIPDPTVVEGIAPIWTDLSGDGKREIIVTVSNANQGAQIVVFDETGAQIAVGPAIGRGNRWRHQIAVAPFGPEGELELVDVLTPHIGGVVEFYRLDGSELRIVAQVTGYTSHVIGTRNLDMAMAGDFDGDNRVELLLPNQARTGLVAIRRTTDGAGVVWAVDVGGVISTNLAGVTLTNGRLAVGVGRIEGLLRLWLP